MRVRRSAHPPCLGPVRFGNRLGIVGANRLSDWYVLRWGHRVYHRLGIPERHALGRIVGEVRAVVLAAIGW